MHDLPWLYRFHKEHHAFNTTTGIAAEHHHILDSLANALPTFIPPILLGMHPFILCIHMALRTWESVDTHTGYAFPWTPFRYLPGMAYQQEYHCFHHHTNIGAYSILLFDHFLGTDSAYLKKTQQNFLGAVTYGWFGEKSKLKN
jgi:sterol desaturase/sphingolipid hydroxylase (fatty acid hydroxylase superfamily)